MFAALSVLTALWAPIPVCPPGVQGIAEAFGSRFTRTTLSATEGVPSSSVRVLCFDRNGFLMVGTTAGLARYDGSRFETFLAAETPGLGGDRIQALLTDRQGRTWIGADQSAPSLLEDGQFREACPPETLSSVHQIVESQSGEIWIAGTALGCYSGGKLEVVDLAGDLPAVWPTGITEDSAGQIWVSTQGGVFRGGTAGFELVDERAGMWITTGFDGGVWSLTTAGDLVPLSGGGERSISFGEIRMGEELARGSGYRVVTTSLGLFSMRASGDNGGQLDFQLIQSPSKETGKIRLLNCLLPGEGADLWAGTEFRGLDYLQRRYVELEPLVPGNAPGAKPRLASIENVFPLSGGRALVHEGRQESPTLIGADGSRKLIRAPIPDYAGVHAVVEHAGEILLSTTKGLARLVGDRIVPDPAWEGAGGPMLRTPDGEVWMCIGDRIHRIVHAGGVDVRGTGIAHPPGKLRALAFHGGAIVGARMGKLMRLIPDEGRWQTIADLGRAHPRKLREDDEGELWVSTYGDGLFRLGPDGSLHHWTRQDGLPDPFLGWIGPVDEQGYIWLNSNSGVLRLSVASLDAYERGEVESIESCTFRAPEANGAGGAELPGGRFALPTLEGLAIFDRSAVALPSQAPGVQILGAFIDGVPARVAKLPKGRATLRFDFSAPIYPTDDGARFQYRLVGLDENWLEAGKERHARFPESPSGDYVFEARTRVPTGSWSTPARSRVVTIQPYWYQRFSVRLLLLGCLLSAIWALVAIRTRSLASRNRALQSEIDQRLRAESDLRSSEARFRHLFHTAPSAIASWTPDGDLLDRNARADELFRLTESEWAIRPPWAHFEDSSLGRSLFRGVLESKRDLNTIASTVAVDGLPRRCSWHLAPTLNSQGDVVSVTALVIDLSRRDRDARSMAELRHSLVKAEESERSRIARELHDDLSQRLAALAFEAHLADRSIPDPGDEGSTTIRSFQAEIESIARDVHGISRQLHPAIVDDLGLLAALQSECGRRSRRGTVQAHVAVQSGVEDPPRDTALALFRIAQEAMRNAERHGQAKEVWVTVSQRRGNSPRGNPGEGIMELSIRDDGVGFDGDAIPIGGIGLKSMRERARLAGGDLRIDTEPGQGTCISVEVPIAIVGGTPDHDVDAATV